MAVDLLELLLDVLIVVGVGVGAGAGASSVPHTAWDYGDESAEDFGSQTRGLS